MSAPVFDIYIRVSQRNGREGDSYQSPKEQERACRELAARRGWEVDRVVVEEDVSGGKRVADRRLEELVRRVESHATAGILAFNVKRFARSVAEGAAAINRIKKADGEFCDAGGNSSRENSLAINIYLAIGEDELEKLTEQWGRSVSNARGLGKFVGPAPFGYVKVDGRLVEHDVEGEILRGTYRAVAAGTLHDGIDYLDEHAPTRTRRVRGEITTYPSKWNTDSVRTMLASRTYLGEHGEGGVEGYDPHAPLVTIALWQAAQSKLDTRAYRQRGGYLLSGLVFCAECGSPLVGLHQRYVDQWQPREYRRYRCAAKPRHGGASADVDALDAHIRAELRDVLGNRAFRDDLMPDGIDDALDAWEQAKDRKRAYGLAADPLDPDFADGAAMHAKRVREAEAEYRRLVGLAESFEVLPHADEVDDDEQLARALRVMLATRGLAFGLGGGRGPLDARVGWLKNGEKVPRALAA
jgi:DNA invertase Pin-like site-specific DNA recombinase